MGKKFKDVESNFSKDNNGSANGSNDKDRLKEPSTKELTWKETLVEYTQNTTLHGVREITEEQPFNVRRVIWVVLVLAGLGAFFYQMTTSVLAFIGFPVTVNIRINYNQTIEFPAVTICNHNSFRMSKVAEMDAYQLITDMYVADDTEIDWEHEPIANISKLEFYNIVAHSQEDFIVSCQWDGEDCGPHDISQYVTDYGLCYAFNRGNGKKAIETGVEGGLRLLLNVEQYEYMPGPNSGAGLKFSLHAPEDIASVKDQGYAIPPGSHSLVAAKVTAAQNLEYPYGECDDSMHLEYYKKYSLQNCKNECHMNRVLAQCGCLDIYMPNTGGHRYCTLQEDFECLQRAETHVHNDDHREGQADHEERKEEEEEEENEEKKEEEGHHEKEGKAEERNGDHLNGTEEHHEQTEGGQGEDDASAECPVCPVPCTVVTYDSTISYSSLSNFDLDTLLHNDFVSQLSIKFISAREASERVETEKVETNQRFVTKLRSTFDFLSNAFKVIENQLGHARDGVHQLINQTKSRMAFHRSWGLEKVTYIMKYDFARGYEIREERYFDYVCANFYSIYEDARRLFDIILAEDDDVVRKSTWTVQRNQLEGRLWLAEVSKMNLLDVNESYYTGDPLLTYRASIDRRYDMSWVSLDYLSVTHDIQIEYCGEASLELDNFAIGLRNIIDLGNTLLVNNTCDDVRLEHSADLLIGACKAINYRLFLLVDRVIYNPELLGKANEDFFDELEADLDAKLDDLEGTMLAIVESINTIEDYHWPHFRQILSESEDYINNQTILKTPLAEHFTSEATDTLIQALQTQFSNVQTRSQHILDSYNDLKQQTINVWKNMLDEITTKPFYKFVHDDYQQYLKTQDNENKYLRIFANLLSAEIEDIRGIYPNYDLEKRINADFYAVNTSLKTDERSQGFAPLWQNLLRINDFVLGNRAITSVVLECVSL
ncbi:hypothetical protein CAPTEDRAFT_206790 [Capitella teleta]|uniref:Uncharacterized protein n=1 Tax=Capitella teleta TaxID=283909 RepID=R7VHM8_CAPTE|nr:hypothetical protein CAPTEDRAFT_206790 [Capitella teleta]|eukprot:ELU18124.1 hypothetical protein CAPTEDRAFT_206790 [Capitella teleta]